MRLSNQDFLAPGNEPGLRKKPSSKGSLHSIFTGSPTKSDADAQKETNEGGEDSGSGSPKKKTFGGRRGAGGASG